MGDRPTRLIDLSHVITGGMVTYKGLPGPHICDFISREQSAANYDDGSTFQIGRIDMVANTGTYVDVPSHRFADGKDLSEVEIEAFANLPALVVRQTFEEGLAVDVAAFDGLDVRGKAVLIATVITLGAACCCAPPSDRLLERAELHGEVGVEVDVKRRRAPKNHQPIHARTVVRGLHCQ